MNCRRFVFAALAGALAVAAYADRTTYYVAEDGDDENNTGLSSESPLATIAAALAKDSAAHVRVASGYYPVSSMIAVTGGALIEGVGDVVVCATNRVQTLSKYDYRDHCAVFDVSHADAILTNLAITTTSKLGSDSTGKWYGRGVYLTDGLVVGCTITNGATANQLAPGGGGVYVAGGTVRACTLASNHADNKYGNNVYMTGGVVEDCVITNGWCYYSNNVRCRGGGGVYMTGGTLRRSLVARNSAEENGSNGLGVYMTGGTMAFCTVTAQTAQGAKTDTRAAVYAGGASVVTNCVLYGNSAPDWQAAATAGLTNNVTGDMLMTGEGNIMDDPRFVAASSCDWHVRPGPASGKGYYPVAVGATTPDCGLFLVTRGNALESDTVTFGSAITGGAVADTTYTWTVTPEEGEAQVKSGKGADYARATFTCPTGLYDVRLDVSVDDVGTDYDLRTGFFRVSAKDIYVEAGVANALTEAAAAAGVGSVLHLTNGLYSYTGTLKIDKAFSVVSADGPEKTRIYSSNGGGSAGTRVVYLTDPGAVLAGVDVTSGASSCGGVLMADGTVTNCHVCNYTTTISGAGVYMTGGTLEDCLITNNCIGTHSQFGVAVYASGACTIQRCRVLDNWLNFSTTAAGGSYGTVYLNGSTAKIVNSLIAFNKGKLGAGIQICGGATVRNCTVAKNTSLWDSDTTTDPAGIYVSGTGYVFDTLKWSNWAKTTECDATDPGFADGANRDFHLVYGSSAIDAATGTLDDLGPVDLDHLGRFNAVNGDDPLPDKGCYEFYESGEIIVAIKDPVHVGTNLTVPYTNEFTVTIAPRSTVVDPSDVWWTFDGRTPTADDHDAEGRCVTNETTKGGSYVANCSVKIGDTVYAADPKEFAVIGDKVYVSSGNPNAKKPYATWATAASTLAQARECLLAGCEMIISNGTYELGSSFTIPANATVRSVNGPAVTTFSGISASPNIKLSSGVLSGIRLYGANAGHSFPGISVSGGTLTNCIVENATCQNNQCAGLSATGGTIVDCTIKSCKPWSGAWASGAQLYGNVFMDRCRFVSCGAGYGSSASQRGALQIAASGGKRPTVRNTIVCGTRHGGCCGIYVEAGTVENCTVASNVTTVTGTSSYGVYAASGTTVRNTVVALNADASGNALDAGGVEASYVRCAVPGGFGTEPVAGELKFRDAANLDFHLRQASPCVNAAAEQAWMTDAKDLDGKPRLQGGPDVGCYERDRNGLAVMFK